MEYSAWSPQHTTHIHTHTYIYTQERHTAHSQVENLRDVPLPEEDATHQEEELEISDEDLDFVKHHSQSIGFLRNLNKAELDKCVVVGVEENADVKGCSCAVWPVASQGMLFWY